MSPLPRTVWWRFAPYAVVSVVHVSALAAGFDDLAGPTKLMLMPALAIAVLWGGRGSGWGAPYTLLFMALALSLLGDGAGTFFPGAPTVPIMLLMFGAAHVVYIRLFVRWIRRRMLPRWAAVYALWWVVLLAILVPQLLGQDGGLGWALAVAIYGLLLGATAVTATRCHPLVTVGAAFFLASDSVLAFLIFTPDRMPAWTNPLVMVLYTLGQGLIAAGVIASTRAATPETSAAEAPA